MTSQYGDLSAELCVDYLGVILMVWAIVGYLGLWSDTLCESDVKLSITYPYNDTSQYYKKPRFLSYIAEKVNRIQIAKT